MIDFVKGQDKTTKTRSLVLFRWLSVTVFTSLYQRVFTMGIEFGFGRVAWQFALSEGEDIPWADSE